MSGSPYFLYFGELDTGINTRTRGYQNHRDGGRILEVLSQEPNGVNSSAAYRLQCINKLPPIIAIMVNNQIFIALYTLRWSASGFSAVV